MKTFTFTKQLILLLLLFFHSLAIPAKIQGGSIQFMKPKAISIHRQDLTLSLDKINSNYVFVNNSALKLIETLVFPVPKDLKKKNFFEEQPFNNLEIIVDGRQINYKTLEHTFNLQEKQYSDIYHYWQQQFLPAQEIHISQIYKPNVKSYKSTVHFTMQKANSAHPWLNKLRHKKSPPPTIIVDQKNEIQNLKISLDKAFPHIKDFCPRNDDYIILLNFFRKAKQKILTSREVQYNLITNDNWSGPIDYFTVQIEHSDNMLPIACWPHKFERTSPTTLLFSAKNHTPMQDLAVLFLQAT